jgi:hypothetical protein
MAMRSGDRTAKREVLVTRCAWCKRYAVYDEWISAAELDQAAGSTIDLRISHGICPHCLGGVREGGPRR